MEKKKEEKKDVTILFAGDSGDGMQLTGNQFTDTNAIFGNDVSTFPNYPAEIRAPQGTLAGVSGFQLHFGSVDIFTAGDVCDVLVVMNSAALKANLAQLRKGGIIIANTAGFDKKNLRLANYEEGVNPLLDGSLAQYKLHEIDVTKMTRAALVDSGMGTKEMDRCKNMFVLGFLYWMYNRTLDTTISFLQSKFANKPALIEANTKVLKTGYHFGDTSEVFTSRFEVKPAPLEEGNYRNIMGNQATAIGVIAAAEKAKLPLFYGSYPITPASDILHELSRHKNFGVKTFQAEDEIAAVCSAIGASFGGALGVTASSGPGIALKGEAMGLAMMLEIPLLVINVQRGGPSTGLPTKTEQSDLMQAFYGRNGEAPIPIVSASTPSDCFGAVYEAIRIAVEFMTPVIFLSDGYIANGSEPWKYPNAADLKEIKNRIIKENPNDGAFLSYQRDELLVRDWALPGTEGLQHRIGGLEKDFKTGNISYDPENHEKMVKVRAEKVANIAKTIPNQEFDSGSEADDVLILGWGSTYGAIKTAAIDLRNDGYAIAHIQLRHIFPFPSNLGDLLKKFDKVVVPELNNGQLDIIIRSEFLIDTIALNKIKGMPFTSIEVTEFVTNLVKND